jgi:dTDP-4-dehydrorhamnose reductase
MKVVLIGADGQLGSDLFERLDKNQTTALYYPEFDITKTEQIKDTLTRLSPSVVINTAAFNRVDECETSPLEAFKINTISVRNLAQVCQKLGAVFVHFSTDYVFNGEKRTPYTEQNSPHPVSLYGLSKLAGEILVRNVSHRFYLIRTCGLYGKAGCWGKGKNFVDAMVEAASKNTPVRVVCDQIVTPTSTSELAQRVIELISTRQFGIYHMTNEGQCTWFDFARSIFELLEKEVELIPVDSNTYGALARRPAFSVLDSRKACRAGITPFSHWKEALRVYMKEKEYI